MTSSTQKIPLPDGILDQLRRETRVPFWSAENSALENVTDKPYAVTMVIPGTRAADAFVDYYLYLSESGLLKKGNAQCLSEDTVKGNHVDGEDSPANYRIVLQGSTLKELQETVNTFCKDLQDHPKLGKAWLQTSPSHFIEALKTVVLAGDKPENLQILEQLAYPAKTYYLDSFLHHLTAQAVSRTSLKQARLANNTLDIISQNVPLLTEHIHAMRTSSRLPALLGDDGEYYLTDALHLRKDGQREMEPFYSSATVWGDKLPAKFSTYTVSFECNSKEQAQELRLHILDALKEVAQSESQFPQLDGYTSLTYCKTSGLQGGYVTFKNDDKTLEIYPPLLLDEVWKLYASMADVIKPSLGVARSMDWARHAEYRSALEGYGEGGYRGGSDVKNVLDPALQRGSYGHLPPQEHFEAIVTDITDMLKRTGDVQTAGSQIMQLAHLTAQGAVKDADNAYPDVKGLLEIQHKSETALTTSQYAALLQERTKRIAGGVIARLRQAGATPDQGDSLAEQLLDASLQLQGKTAATDDEVMNNRIEREARYAYASLAKKNPDSFSEALKHKRRLSSGEEQSEQKGIKGDRGDWLVSLQGALGKGPADEPMLLERPYHNPFYHPENPYTENTVYWSRNGERSLMPPRFELPSALEVMLAKERSQKPTFHVAGLLERDNEILPPEKSRG